MAENKTKPEKTSVAAFLRTIPDAVRKDCEVLVDMMSEISGEKAVMWGSAIIGFGLVHYKYASGREGDMPVIAFSPRKQNLTLYLMMGGFDDYEKILEKLGKYKTSKACLYFKKLADIDKEVLREWMRHSVEQHRLRKQV